MTTIDAMFDAARRRLYKAIDLRCALFIAGTDRSKQKFARRSVGQHYRKPQEKQ